MKVLMLCEFYHADLEYQENLLVKYYRKHGHDVTVITSTFEDVFDYYNNNHDNSLPRSEFYDHGARIIRLPFRYNILGKLKKYVSIKKIVEDFQPDLLYIHDIMPNMLETLDYKKRNPHVKMIMDYHADYSNSANNWLSLNVLHKVLRKRLYFEPVRPHLSRLYPIVPGSVKFLKEVYKVPDEKMEILPLGADVDLAADLRTDGTREEVRRELGIAATDILIFSGGKFTPLKKTELLLQAVNEISDSRLHVVTVGGADDANKEYFDKLLGYAQDNKNIHFAGWQNNRGVYRYLAAADFAVFPASQSILWQQALAAGLPLIVGDTGEQSLAYLNEYGAIREMSGKDITAENLKIHILELLKSEKALAERQQNALKTAAEYLDWNHLINKTLQRD